MSDKLSQRPDETRAKSIAKLYVDPISPYAYFYLKQIDRLDDLLDIRITPILFGAVLAHWGQLGPAEIEPSGVIPISIASGSPGVLA